MRIYCISWIQIQSGSETLLRHMERFCFWWWTMCRGTGRRCGRWSGRSGSQSTPTRCPGGLHSSRSARVGLLLTRMRIHITLISVADPDSHVTGGLPSSRSARVALNYWSGLLIHITMMRSRIMIRIYIRFKNLDLDPHVTEHIYQMLISCLSLRYCRNWPSSEVLYCS